MMHLPTEGFKYQLELITKENIAKSTETKDSRAEWRNCGENFCATQVGRLVVCGLVKLADAFLTVAQTIVWRTSVQAQAEHLDLSQHANTSHPSR